MRLILSGITKAATSSLRPASASASSAGGYSAGSLKLWEINIKEIIYDYVTTDEEDENGDLRKDKVLMGEGAMGKVYAGKYRGQPVAVKVVKFSNLVRDEAFFVKEVEVLQRLHHPHIAYLIGAGFSDTRVKGKSTRSGISSCSIIYTTLYTSRGP